MLVQTKIFGIAFSGFDCLSKHFSCRDERTAGTFHKTAAAAPSGTAVATFLYRPPTSGPTDTDAVVGWSVVAQRGRITTNSKGVFSEELDDD